MGRDVDSTKKQTDTPSVIPEICFGCDNSELPTKDGHVGECMDEHRPVPDCPFFIARGGVVAKEGK